VPAIALEAAEQLAQLVVVAGEVTWQSRPLGIGVEGRQSEFGEPLEAFGKIRCLGTGLRLAARNACEQDRKQHQESCYHPHRIYRD
jgi:hypothetical protein